MFPGTCKYPSTFLHFVFSRVLAVDGLKQQDWPVIILKKLPGACEIGQVLS